MTALALLALTASPAAAFTHSSSVEKKALSGQEIYLYGGSTLNPDCSKAGNDDVRATSGPSHGKIKIVHGKTFAFYPKKDQRSKCNSRKVDGIRILYRSNAGFKGRDQVNLSIHTYTGNSFSTVIYISVE
ncbi:hypothetical protein [Mesorhizobium shangrilense]|uniref:Uncharacterized protein n=1 Tax=Mesorhizobium shangrilense TaxID=460060 RepID=A0ABV2D5X3_9HYPH